MANQQEEKISFWEKSGYGLGDLASNLFWMTFIFYMPYFYTDVFGISSAVMGTMFLLTRIWDGFNDPMMGMIADRTETKWGKFRPYLVWMCLPFAIIGILMFTTPNLSMQGKVIYAYITYTLMGMVYTAINIPYGSMMAVVSSNPLVRTQFSQYRFIMAFTGGLIVQATVLPMVNMFGGNETSVVQAQLINKHQIVIQEKGEGTSRLTLVIKGIEKKPIEKNLSISVLSPANYNERDTSVHLHYLVTGFKVDTVQTATILNGLNIEKADVSIQVVNERKGYQAAISVFAVLSVILFLLTFWLTKERVKPPVDQQTSVKNDLKDLLSNGPWKLLFVLGIFTLTHVCIRNGAIIYYFKYYINNTDLATSFMICGSIATLVAIPFTGWIAKFIGKKNAFLICMAATTILSMAYFFVGPTNIYAIFGLQIAINFFFGPTAPLMFSMYTDTADYSEYKTGRRATGLVMSASTMAQKLGWAFGGAVTGWLFALYGYKANVEQTPEALSGILAMMSWIPAIASGIGMGLMMFYTLSEKKMLVIEEELKMRRTN